MLAKHMQVSMHGVNKPSQSFEQGGFTRTIRTNEHEQFAWVHVEHDAFNYRMLSVTHAQVVG
jgi:hypothetical protein